MGTEQRTSARGFILLVVVAATAVLAALVGIALMSAAATAEAARFRLQRLQAENLVRAAMAQTSSAIAEGRVPVPPAGARVVVRDGATSSGLETGVGTVPPMPGWPALGNPAGLHGTRTRGVRVEITRVRGPDGRSRGLDGVDDGTILLEVTIDAWFGLARADRVGRLLWTTDGVVDLW